MSNKKTSLFKNACWETSHNPQFVTESGTFNEELGYIQVFYSVWYQHVSTIHFYTYMPLVDEVVLRVSPNCTTGAAALVAATTAQDTSSPDWQHFTEKKQQAQNGKVAWEPPGEGCNYSGVDNAMAYIQFLATKCAGNYVSFGCDSMRKELHVEPSSNTSDIIYLYGAFPIDRCKSV